MERAAADSLSYLIPELVLLATWLVVGALGWFTVFRRWLDDLALVGVAGAIWATGQLVGWGEGWIVDRLLIVDGFAVFGRLLIQIPVLMLLWGSEPDDRGSPARLVGGALVGGLLLSSANLWASWASLEVLILLASPGALGRRVSLAGSAAWAVALAWIALGAGTLDLVELRLTLVAAGKPVRTLPPLFLVVLGTVLKIAGSISWRHAPARSVILLATIARTAILGFLLRFVYTSLAVAVGDGLWRPVAGGNWQPLLLMLSVVSLLAGAVAVTRQESVLRLVVLSSLAQGAFALAGFSIAGDPGIRAGILCLVADVFTGMGAIVAAIRIRHATGSEQLDTWRGLVRGEGRLFALALVVFLASLGAVPGTVGFVSRFLVVSTLIADGMAPTAAIALVATVILFFAYARVVRVVIFSTPHGHEPPFRRETGPRNHVQIALGADGALALLAGATILFGLWRAPVLDAADRAARLFVG